MSNLPYTSDNWLEVLNYAPVLTRYPMLNEQTPDGYPQTHTRFLEYPRSLYEPRASVRTSWTNLFTRSHTPAHADWSKTNLTASDSQAANPENGLTTAGRLLETSATGEHKLTRSPTFTAADHVVDFCAKAIGDRWLRLHTNDGTEDYEAWFHPTSGAWKYFADVINATTGNGTFATAGGGGADVFGTWTESTSGSSTLTRDTADYDVSPASCRMDVDGSNSSVGVSRAGILTPGRRYRATIRAKCASGSQQLRVEDGGVNFYGTLDLTSSYATYTVDFTAATADFGLYRGPGATGLAIRIGSVQLTPITVAPLINATTGNGTFATAGGGGADVFGTWTESTSGSSTLTRDTADYDVSPASCRMDVDGSNSSVGVSRAGILTPGRSYRATIRAKCASGSQQLRVEDGGANFYGTLDLTSSYATYTVDFTAAGADFGLYRGPGATGLTIRIGSVQLTQTSLPTVTMTALPWPAEGWYRCSFIAPHRAATGTLTLAVSSDGTTLSYAGDTAKGAYIWGFGLYAASTLGPIVETLGSTRTVSAPDTDEEDPFAYLVAESEPQPVAGDLYRVERTYARLPAQQLTRDYQSFSRPNCSGLRSGGTYAANVDGDESFRLWTARKSVLGYQTTAGGTTSNTLPSGNVTITLTDASFVTQPANASQATWQAAVNSAIVGTGKLSSCQVIRSGDGSTLVFWIYTTIGAATVASVSNPSGTTLEQTGSMIRLTAFGTSITPDTKLVHCPSHGAAVGERVALWNGHALVATGSVAGVSDANYLSIVLSDLNSPDFNFTHLTLGDDAAFRYASGAREINIRTARDFWLPGVTMLSDGTTLSTLDSLPAVSTYQSAQAWLDRIVAADTYTAINASQLATYLGPIQHRDTVYAKKDATCLESLTLT